MALLLNSKYKTVLTLIVKAEVEAVEAAPILLVRVLHPVSEAGIYMC